MIHDPFTEAERHTALAESHAMQMGEALLSGDPERARNHYLAGQFHTLAARVFVQAAKRYAGEVH